MIDEKRLKLIEIIVKHQIRVKGHQRKTKSGKIATVPEHIRKGDPKKEILKKPRTKKQEEPTKKQKARGEYNKKVKKDLESGIQTQIGANGKPKMPTFQELTEIYKGKKEIPKSIEKRYLEDKYNNTMTVQTNLVKMMGGIEEARETDAYKTLIGVLAKQQKKIRELRVDDEENDDKLLKDVTEYLFTNISQKDTEQYDKIKSFGDELGDKVKKRKEEKWLKSDEAKGVKLYGYTPESMDKYNIDRFDEGPPILRTMADVNKQFSSIFYDTLKSVGLREHVIPTDMLAEFRDILSEMDIVTGGGTDTEQSKIHSAYMELREKVGERASVYDVTKASQKLQNAQNEMKDLVLKTNKLNEKLSKHLDTLPPPKPRYGGMAWGTVKWIQEKCVSQLPSSVQHTVRCLNGEGYMRMVSGNLSENDQAVKAYGKDLKGKGLDEKNIRGFWNPDTGDAWWSDYRLMTTSLHEIGHGVHLEYLFSTNPAAFRRIINIYNDYIVEGYEFPTEYSGEDEGEFFATSFERYFNTPYSLYRDHREIYDLIHTEVLKRTEADSVGNSIKKTKNIINAFLNTMDKIDESQLDEYMTQFWDLVEDKELSQEQLDKIKKINVRIIASSR